VSNEPIKIYVKSGLSRGKAAAAAVHAALLALDVHPNVPVIVLSGNNKDIEDRRIVVRDAGKTEVEPGTMTAGTDYRKPVKGAPRTKGDPWLLSFKWRR
jgi:peptidyl-tRNA hydrolase, PTH2 family